jgi:hypothetical protein
MEAKLLRPMTQGHGDAKCLLRRTFCHAAVQKRRDAVTLPARKSGAGPTLTDSFRELPSMAYFLHIETTNWRAQIHGRQRYRKEFERTTGKSSGEVDISSLRPPVGRYSPADRNTLSHQQTDGDARTASEAGVRFTYSANAQSNQVDMGGAARTNG